MFPLSLFSSFDRVPAIKAVPSNRGNGSRNNLGSRPVSPKSELGSWSAQPNAPFRTSGCGDLVEALEGEFDVEILPMATHSRQLLISLCTRSSFWTRWTRSFWIRRRLEISTPATMATMRTGIPTPSATPKMTGKERPEAEE